MIEKQLDGFHYLQCFLFKMFSSGYISILNKYYFESHTYS